MHFPSLPATGTKRSFRFVIYALTISMCVICYGDRAALSAGMSQIAHEFSLTPGQTGWVLSSFLWSYFILNLPAAILLDRFGERVIGALAVALWSIAMILGSLTATVPAFIATRILLGVGEAPTFALGNKVIRAWAPASERGVMMTAFVCGIPIGLAAGAASGAWLIANFGWRSAFIFLGCLGLAWSLAWLVIHPRKETARHGTNFALLSVPTLFASGPFWGIVIAQCCGNYANFLLMSWLPIILRQTLHLSLTGSGVYTGYCYLGAAILSITAGKIGESLVRGHSLVLGARRNIVSIYLVLASMMGLLPLCSSGLTMIPLLAVSMGFISAGLGANMALIADLLVEHEMLGSVTGLILTFSNGLGILAPVLTGYLLQATGNFHGVFYITSVIILAGAIAARLMPTRVIHGRRQQDANA
ncbi:MFS transporter [Gluconobacter thailandicus]|uniref:MFS transporter n=1 Tax=Gluconobacter thailandicus TaxID=257438 RepID=A0AAP9ET90_GLUTH|nr:MFS transporter [Gluconobacter thailandicus]QEH96956.1 MFS transporter [Gluconobacter thailandicus]